MRSSLPLKRIFVLATTGIAILIAVSAWSQSRGDISAYTIRMQTPETTGQSIAPSLAIFGNWPTQCPPTLEHVTRDGNDVHVEARAMLSLCEHKPMPFTIEVNPALALNQPALAPGVYHVSFFAANGVQSEPKLRAFSLFDTSAERKSVAGPEAGFWWTTSSSSSETDRAVISIEAQGNHLSVALMSYNADGSTAWQFGTGRLNGHIAHVPLLRLLGGSDLFSASGSSPRGEPGLNLDLEFQSNSRALAWLSRAVGSANDPELELQTFMLSRLPFTAATDGSAWRGEWILATDTDFVPLQRLRLNQLRSLESGEFELRDNLTSVALTCQHDAAHAELPPRECVLHQVNGVELGHFNAVAIDRMEGTRSDGFGVHLMRIRAYP